MAKVAVITRTKNRNVLLRRALASVASQSFADWEQIIVNDGGEPGPLDALLAAERLPGRRTVVHNPLSRGMEAASNIGIRASNSEYIVIHDDDDSWHPQFLARTVEYLERPENHRFSGVVTHSVKVTETLDGPTVTVTGRELFNGSLTSIDLHTLAAGNLYPPISFLYKRAALMEIGDYREDLPPLADWEFNLRFLSRFPIGVLAEPLANYHHRRVDRGSAYANTVVAGLQQHALLDVVVRNEITSRDLCSGAASLGAIMQAARGFGGVFAEIKRLDERFDRLEHLLFSGIREDLRALMQKPTLAPNDSADIARVLERLQAAETNGPPNPADTDLTFQGYLAELERILTHERRLAGSPAIVFGASPFGARIIERLRRHGFVVTCVFDNNPNRIGSKLLNVAIVTPRTIAPGHLVVNASINHNVAIHEQIRVLAAGGASTIISFKHPIETSE